MSAISNNRAPGNLREENRKLLDEIEDVRSKNDYLETLLKESHHRTKNHLAVLMSALSYRGKFSSSEASAALVEARTMVMSVVTLNELLNTNGSIRQVSTQHYLTELAKKVFAICQGAKAGISLMLAVEDIELDHTRLLACGMLVNELIVNAFKHAFPDGEEGTITVFLCCKTRGRIRLGVRDDGMGIPARSHDSTGFELVKVLCEQLGGTLEIRYDNGTECWVSFKP